MILIAAVTVALLVGLLRGGRLEHLASLPLRWGGVVIVAFLMQAYFMLWPPSSWVVDGTSVQGAVLTGAALAVLAVVWVNRHLRGIVLLGCGLILNLVVMAANGGLMPITAEALRSIGHEDLVVAMESGATVGRSKDVVLTRAEMKLWFLADVLVIPRPFPLASAFSLGDVVIAAGAFLALQDGLTGRHRPPPRDETS